MPPKKDVKPIETIKATKLDIKRISGPNPPSDQREQLAILESSSGPTANVQVLQAFTSINTKEESSLGS